MSDTHPEEKPKSGAESPTTAKEVDFDEETQETGVTSPKGASSSPSKRTVSSEEEEAPPTKPPRPLSPQQQMENTLIEAFPSIDAKVVRAVLMASGGQLEPAFNALLGMSDPDFKPEEAAPPQPPRPTAAQRQLEQDELYARQLAEHYQNVQRPPRSSSYDQRERNPPLPRRPNQQNVPHDELYDDRERSFFDDDLPVIRKNIEKGFLETQSKVNKWISDFKKRIDGDEDDPYDGPTRQEGPSQHYRQDSGPQNDRVYGIRKSADIGRRSGGRESYDADPHVLGDDFTALELRDDDAPPARPSSGRPLANPDLFKTSVAPPQSGPVDEVDAIDRKLQKQTSPKDDVKQAKWQPLTSVAPNPESEDNDPFSLGDSDDEKEKEDKTKDLREADTNRLKEAARNSVSAGSSDSAPKGLQASERSGSMSTKNKEAEELLAGKK